MIIPVNRDSVPFFEALASDVRVEILHLLAGEDLNIKQLAEKIGISSSIMTRHVQKLENAGIIKSSMVTVNGASHKKCVLMEWEYRLQLPHRTVRQNIHEVSIPVGHYSDIKARPTCGVATEDSIIGYFDEPRFLMDPQRVHAQIFWFAQGYVEYKFPNYVLPDQTAEEITISLEISSEAPGYNEEWPSDITFYLNGIRLFDWTCPGDFGKRHGVLTPMWWQANQYGLLKLIRIDQTGTYLDETRMSDVTIADVCIPEPSWSLRLEVSEQAEHVGGLTIYGKKFGNYNQDILVRTFYSTPYDAQQMLGDMWQGRLKSIRESVDAHQGPGEEKGE